INEAGIPILAVDVPSGLNAETGEPMGEAIRATRTITVGAPKVGFVAAPAWEYVGQLEVAKEIGLATNTTQTDLQWTQTSDFIGYPPPRPISGHKGTFGHVAIVAGSMGYHGAAVLSTRG